jgi:enterochelin esterase family protein
MKKILPLVWLASLLAGPLVAQQAHVNLDWNPQKNTENLIPYGGATVISPDVLADGRITFRLEAPQARTVELTGSPILLALKQKQPVPFVRDEKGLWTLTVGPVAPNIYVYKLRIDGVTVADPNNTFTGFADQPAYSMVIVAGDKPAYYDAQDVPHGAVTRHIYHSRVTGGEREMFVYTPPGYDPAKTYPVLYLLGGSGELASTWDRDGRASCIADNLYAAGQAQPMLIVMPNNQVIHRSAAQHAEKSHPLFARELREEIVPFVEQHYRVQADRHGRALAGLSMGGRHAQMVGFKSLDLFASFGLLSAGDVDAEKSSPEFLNNPQINAQLDYLFVGLGTYEEAPDNRSVVFHQILARHGITHDYYIGGNGGHDWATWRDHLHYLLPKLWRAGR